MNRRWKGEPWHCNNEVLSFLSGVCWSMIFAAIILMIYLVAEHYGECAH